MSFISSLAFIFFILLPAISIFAFISKLTSGIYHWADRQHYDPSPIQISVKTIETVETLQKTSNPEERYLGHKAAWEDSEEYTSWLDKQSFDVRQHL